MLFNERGREGGQTDDDNEAGYRLIISNPKSKWNPFELLTDFVLTWQFFTLQLSES